MHHKHREHYKKHVDIKLRRRLFLFLIIFVILIGLVIYESIVTLISRRMPVIGVLIGLGVGLIMGRFQKVIRHQEDSKVITQTDVMGIVVIVVYIILALSRRWILAFRVEGPAMITMVLAITAGTMIGRVFGISHNIKKVLKEAGIRDS